MIYKVFTQADLSCPFRTNTVRELGRPSMLPDNNIPDKYKTNNFARKFCKGGCCIVCSPLFWWVRILGRSEDSAPWEEFNDLVTNPNKIILLPFNKKEAGA